MIVRFKYLGIPIKSLDNKVYDIELKNDADVEDLVDKISEVYCVNSDYIRKSTFLINNARGDMNSKLIEGCKITIIKALGGG